MRNWSIVVGLLVAVSGCVATPLSAPGVDSSRPSLDAQPHGFRPAVDFGSWRASIAGPPTKVANLGSIHLSELGQGYDPAPLGPLIDKLAAFAPDIITHEGLSGEQCELVQRHIAIYPGIFDDYCYGTTEGEAATGLTMPKARAEAEVVLAAWPAQPSAAQRRHLAALFIASGDRNSALVQWLHLPVAERTAGDGLNDVLVEIVEKQRKRVNETTLIGAVLAARLGHQRMYAVDDHTSDAIQASAPPGFVAAIQAHWAGSRAKTELNPAIKRYGDLMAGMTTPEGVFAMFRLLQEPETQRAFVENDFLAALNLESPERFGRQYVAWYETRNLRMVANIRAAFGNKPGARVLNIVGASHKAYYDAYLSQMSDVQLVDMGQVLR